MSPEAPDAPSHGAAAERQLAEDSEPARGAGQNALDRAASERDQDLSNADQRASDHDQVAADRVLAAGAPGDYALQRSHDVSSSERNASTASRAASSVLRAQNATVRLDQADRRDEESRERDLAADARDREAEALDRTAARFQAVGPAADARARAATDRAQAAADRQRAAKDRDQAAVDRRQVRGALAEAHLDELTGTYRRGLGILALQREINRARHSTGQLVLAFVDVDGLKQVNDREGHAAGDALLIDVAATIRSFLRSYDPIVRYGGDEFICAFSDFGLEEVHVRFEQIQAALEKKRKGCSISFGLAQLKTDETLDQLTARGDAALYDARRSKRSLESDNGSHTDGGAPQPQAAAR